MNMMARALQAQPCRHTHKRRDPPTFHRVHRAFVASTHRGMRGLHESGTPTDRRFIHESIIAIDTRPRCVPLQRAPWVSERSVCASGRRLQAEQKGVRMQAPRALCSRPNHLARGHRAIPTGYCRPGSKAKAKVGSLPVPAEDLLLADLRVVLVAPKTEANVGAVARACGNFEAAQLCIVAPRCNVQSDEVAWVACGTYVTDRLRVVSSLEEALADCVGSVGFSRRSGSTRYVHACLGDLLSHFPDSIPGMLPTQGAGSLSAGKDLPPAAATDKLQAGTVALVFGREESGLTQEELRLVSHVCAIPSGRIQPSLNLSHAVAVVLSECFNRRAYDQSRTELMSNDRPAASPPPADLSRASEHMGASTQEQEEASKPVSDAGALSRPFWLESTLQPGGKYGAKDRNIQFAVVSEVEPLLKKVAWIAQAVGVSNEDSTSGGVHGRKRLPMGHLRAILGRAKATTSEINSIHGFASAVVEMLHPGHPLGKRKKGGEQGLQSGPPDQES